MAAESTGWDGSSRASGTLLEARRQLGWPAEREFRLLSIDGGGIKGIFAAAFLARLESDHLGGRSIARCFDMIAGTSTGGIIALALAMGIPASAVLNLYMTHGGKIFPRRRQFGVVQPAFKREPLAAELEGLFGDQTLGDARARLCIPSADGRHGDVAIFKTPHHPDYRRDWQMRAVDAALATSAAPTFLRVHESAGYRFIDGGVWANNPVMVGLVDALACFKVERRQVRVLSIGTGARKPILGPLQMLFGGVIGWIMPGTLIESMMTYSSLNADGQAGLLIGRDHLHRVEPRDEAAGVHMTDHATAVRLLPQEGSRVAKEHGSIIEPVFLVSEAEPATFFYGPRTAT